ncbi:MAG: metallophosphoesterase family protein [Thermoanaerobaculia bacterium]
MRARPVRLASALAVISAATALTALGALDPDAARAATVARGPYLQRLGTSSVVVHWRTDEATDSWAGAGVGLGDWTATAVGATPAVEHALELTGLSPATDYFYAVGTASAVLAGGTPAFHFRTAPEAAAPLRIWVTGDTGTGGADAGAVRDAFRLWTGAREPDAWLMLGDNAYAAGTDAEYQTKLFAIYPDELATWSLWPALGNHDAVSSDSASQSGPFFTAFDLPAAGENGGKASGTEAYFSWELGDVHFVELDSAGTDLGASSPMLDWLAADLADNLKPWVVAYFHHPPYTHGTHDSDDPADSGGRMAAMRALFLPVLEALGADLVLCGHSHDYERSDLLDGHYGTSDTLTSAMILDSGDGSPAGSGVYLRRGFAHGGTVYVVAGTGAQTGGGPLDHPAMQTSLSALGSFVLDVAPGRLEGRFVDAAGVVRDRFTLIHESAAIFGDRFESGDFAAWSAAATPP